MNVLPGDIRKIRRYCMAFMVVFIFVMIIYVASTRSIDNDPFADTV